jgi:hypothetical protein
VPRWATVILIVVGLALTAMGMPAYGIIPFALCITVNGQRWKKEEGK